MAAVNQTEFEDLKKNVNDVFLLTNGIIVCCQPQRYIHGQSTAVLFPTVIVTLHVVVGNTQDAMGQKGRWLVLRFDWFYYAKHLGQSGQNRDEFNFSRKARTD
uniref:Uncharacterized protein n=1 Tax=Timema cristinae TaxID=61476 RepID=A0A7R9CHQ5_TIMCR|nr:unnamed protein product [Timema cristinae]